MAADTLVIVAQPQQQTMPVCQLPDVLTKQRTASVVAIKIQPGLGTTTQAKVNLLLFVLLKLCAKQQFVAF